MRQTLFYLPVEIFGIPLFGKGLLFWAILLAGLASIIRVLVQKKKIGDAIFYACMTALGIFIVNAIGPRIVEPQGFPIRGYGVFLTLAIVVSSAVTLRRGKKLWNYPVELILSIVFVAAFSGIIGARLFYVAQYWDELQTGSFRETLINAIDVTNGGLVVYGSIIGGIVAVVIFLIAKRLPVLATLDLFAPGLALGIAIGRLGCLMNGCCFGGACDLPWAIVFPPDSPAYTQQLDEGVISLYGITLSLPETKDNPEKNLFSIKKKHINIATETIAPVVIDSVDPGSEAEKAGIKAGDRICNVGIVPKGFNLAVKNVEGQTKQSRIKRYRVENNAQVFYFFLNIWNPKSDADVILTLMNKDGKKASDDEKKRSAVNARDVVFHPEPARAKPVHPTQIYSSINMSIVCVTLLFLSRIVKRDGIVFAALLLLYPIHRFCIELLRTDEESFCGTGLTVSQCVSLATFAIGIALSLYLLANKPKRALEGFFPKDEENN